ncbi:MAG TPA: hypothetical protein VNJ46_07765 [Gaiellaceae bacterium]|nr:hypothetical protein [Gaiellaceae bacterium]
MSAVSSAWVVALAATLAMVFLGTRLGMLSLPEPKVRCVACGRLHRRRRPCPCSEPRDG